VFEHGRNAEEAELMVRLGGMSPREVLVAATTGAAELLGLAQTQATWSTREHGDIPRNLAAAEQQLPPEAFTAALQRGSELHLAGAVAETLADLLTIGAAPEQPREDDAARRSRRLEGNVSPRASAVGAPPIRVLIVDALEIVRQGLVRLLDGSPSIEVIAEAASGGDALRLVDTLRPDVVLLDLALPDSDGVEIVRRLLAADNPPHVLILTGEVGDDRVRDAIGAGVIGYLLKDIRRDDLVRAIETAATGRPVLDPVVQRYLMQQSSAPAQPAVLAALTERERDLMRCLAQGLTNRQIAADLGLTHGTVKVYMSALLDKLGVADRTRAALIAARLIEQQR